MLHGILFELLSLAMCVGAAQGGWFLLLIWRSASVFAVAMGYHLKVTLVYGKRPDGTTSPLNTVILLPWLLYARGVWNVLRIVSSEDPYNELARAF